MAFYSLLKMFAQMVYSTFFARVKFDFALILPSYFLHTTLTFCFGI